MSKPLPNGYRKRPWELTLLAVFFALVPLLSWLTRYLSFVLAGQPGSGWEALASFFAAAGNGPIGLAHSVLMAGLWLLFLAVAWGIFKVAKWGFLLCIVAAVANALFSMVQYGVGDSGTGVQEFVTLNPIRLDLLLNLVFFIPVVMILNQKIMAPFFNPRMKWWEQHPRVKAMLKIEANIDGTVRTYHSFDISASGMFLGTPEFPDLPVGGKFPTIIHLEESGTAIEVLCQAVWISDGKGRAPVGIGVTFEYPRKGDRKVLGRYIKAKIREGQLIERA